MQRLPLATALALASFAASAQNHAIFGDGFDPPTIAPQFQKSGDAYVIPADAAAGPAAAQARWLLSELAAGQTTSAAEASAHFVTSDAQGTANFIGAIRSDYPDARVVDLITLTPNHAEFMLKGSGTNHNNYYVYMQVQYTGAKKISYFYTSSDYATGSVIAPGDASLNLVQAVSALYSKAPDSSVLVAKIDANDQCVAVSQADATEPRSTASIIKSWVLFGAARMIADGQLHADDSVPLDSDLFSQGADLNNETPNTPIPLLDLAKMMTGNSDNTATDLIEHRVGRDRLEAAVGASGYGDLDVLKPFLSMSENFHLAFSFPASTTNAYMSGSEGYQRQFLEDDIVPLGGFTDASPHPYFNESIFSRGGWTASPNDVCAVLARLRRLPQGSEAMQTVDAALGSTTWLPDVRNHWERVWYKEGLFYNGSGGNYVYNNVWLLENVGEQPYVFISMLNDDAAGLTNAGIGQVDSVNARILQILATQHP
jgi:hypothetical protein